MDIMGVNVKMLLLPHAIIMPVQWNVCGILPKMLEFFILIKNRFEIFKFHMGPSEETIFKTLFLLQRWLFSIQLFVEFPVTFHPKGVKLHEQTNLDLTLWYLEQEGQGPWHSAWPFVRWNQHKFMDTGNVANFSSKCHIFLNFADREKN